MYYQFMKKNYKQFNMEELDKKFQELGWKDTTEAYYGLDFTPFMNVVEELIEQVKNEVVQKYTRGEKVKGVVVRQSLFYLQEELVQIELLFGKIRITTPDAQRMHKMLFGSCQSISTTPQQREIFVLHVNKTLTKKR